MSLLYECINGIIQGGILDEAEGIEEGDEVASLCVAKLRGMIAMDADPNRTSPATFNFFTLSLTAGMQSSTWHCLRSTELSYHTQR